jgi:hypothetical protein
MEWTTRYFWHRAKKWGDLSPGQDIGVGVGQMAYAARQAAQWAQMASDANRAFIKTNRDYKSVVM